MNWNLLLLNLSTKKSQILLSESLTDTHLCLTSHALINITDNIRKALDDGNIGCGNFLDLQKAFDTVDHHIC